MLSCLAMESTASPLSIARNEKEISLRWASLPGQYFDIQRSEDLIEWSEMIRGYPAMLDDSFTPLVFEDKPASAAFFRIAPPGAVAESIQSAINNDILMLEWESRPGEHFDIEYLDIGNRWEDLITGIPASAESSSTSREFAGSVPDRTYRVVSAKSRPFISRVAWLGDSITGGETNQDGRCHLATGRLVHVLLKQRITPVANSIRGDWDFGWSGFTSQQLIQGRPDLPGVFPVQWVIDSGADACIVHIGTNNITWGQSVEMIVSSITDVWDLLRAANITTVGTEITPWNVISSVAVVDSINARLKAEALVRGMIFAEWNHIGRLDDGTADSRHYPDGLHPNAIANSKKAVYLAELLSRKTVMPPESGSVTPDWITPNPAMSSSAGKPPVSWQNYPPAGSTVEFSSVPSSVGGDPWLQIVVRQAEGAYEPGYFFVSANATLHEGDLFHGTLDLESEADWDFKEISIRIANVGYNARDLYVGGAGGIRELPGPVSRYQGKLRTPTLPALEETNRAGFFIHYWGSGTFRVRGAGIQRVTHSDPSLTQ